MNSRLWNVYDAPAKAHFRAHNMIGRGTVRLVDDTKAAQLFQFEGFGGELRSDMQRVGHFGFGAVPLVGASLATLHQGGHRGFNTATGVEDGRYRPTGFKGGESYQYMVDGANASTGAGGTTRMLLQGLLGWLTTLFGKTINVGDGNAVTINVGTAASSVTVNMGGSGAAVNITGGSGDVMVAGVSLVHHVHSNAGGSGDSGPPVAS